MVLKSSRLGGAGTEIGAAEVATHKHRWHADSECEAGPCVHLAAAQNTYRIQGPRRAGAAA
eukprot:COSAG02_NODE_9124_length_2322_cov_10.678363_1_plen_60_part_10